MGPEYISFWIPHVFVHSAGNPMLPTLQFAWRFHIPMLASVTSLKLHRTSEQLKVGLQVYLPQRGLGMQNWRGFDKER